MKCKNCKWCSRDTENPNVIIYNCSKKIMSMFNDVVNYQGRGCLDYVFKGFLRYWHDLLGL